MYWVEQLRTQVYFVGSREVLVCEGLGWHKKMNGRHILTWFMNKGIIKVAVYVYPLSVPVQPLSTTVNVNT